MLKTVLTGYSAFLKLKTNGTVETEINAETTNAKPSNPAETPKENALAAKTGATVCANPAIAQATPNAPPCAFSGVFVEINVFRVTIWIPKPKDITAETANNTAKPGVTDKARSPTTRKAIPIKVKFNRLNFLLRAGNQDGLGKHADGANKKENQAPSAMRQTQTQPATKAKEQPAEKQTRQKTENK